MKNKKKGFNIPMDKRLYSRPNCIRLSEKLIESGRVKRMSRGQLACELFGHAYVYYNFRVVPGFLKGLKPFRMLYKCCADGVDLADNGDTLIRRIVYRILWIMPAFPLKDSDQEI